MTPEIAAHLARATEGLEEARLVATIPLARLAARSAYLAAFHAAEALIIAKTGKVAKTHAGVHAEFARLTRDLPASDGELRRVLGRGYAFKELADYGTDPTRVVTVEDATAMITDSARFVARVTDLLAAASPDDA
ncbi:MAG: HEPN domain-containing protein [Janthinobacterium lividum]